MAIQTSPTPAVIKSINQAFPAHWYKADGTQKRRIVMSVEGETGTGKTEFALSAPGPIAFFKFDLNCDFTVEKWAHDKAIWVIPCRKPNRDLPKDEVQKDAIGVMEQFTEDYARAIADRTIRSIVWDTASEIWEVIRLATFGKVSGVLPREYGPVNRAYHRLIEAATESDSNLIMVHHLKDEWTNNAPTGVRKRDGYKKVPEACQIVLRTDFTNRVFSLEVLKCTQNKQLEGSDAYRDGPYRTNTFAHLAADVFPDTTLEEWQ